MAWIQYTGQKIGNQSVDAITVTRSGTVGLSKAFVEKHDLRRFRNVVLYFDRELVSIGLHFVMSKQPDSRAITHDIRGGGASIACRELFRFGLDTKVSEYAGKYTYRKVQQNDLPELFIVDLKPKVEK